MPPKATRTKNTGNNTRQSRGARSTMSKTNAGHNTNQPKITDLGAATSKKGAVRKARREGGIGSKMDLDKKPTEAATAPSSSPRVVGIHQEHLSQEEILLRKFDLDYKYGPCVGLTRMERWLRAEKLGLNPPKEVKEQLERGAAKDSVLNDACYYYSTSGEGQVVESEA
ncbi:hypothetical protein O0I10_005057 [Lichtheimia ornata]|uniref:DNA polymerase delta subunit 4 n=1 Tax=Lichtheimia ornata TaxID=688661 RepID=A0AAD7V7G8_9FUNG|nr:uncharacterized protein O0I10_005057 [Lichtheimia ornata]KAJ8659342.1 hypothetical protein O0I10_005057 [Lichtheimia ornata]